MDEKAFLQLIVDLFPERQLTINMSFDSTIDKLKQIFKERSFTSLLTQTGTNAPVINVLRNDFPPRVITRHATGTYHMPVSDIIKIGKIAPVIEAPLTDADGNVITCTLVDNSYYEITTKTNLGVLADGILNNQFFEFSIY